MPKTLTVGRHRKNEVCRKALHSVRLNGHMPHCTLAKGHEPAERHQCDNRRLTATWTDVNWVEVIEHAEAY